MQLELIDAGAEDFETEEGLFEIYGPMESFGTIQNKLQELGMSPEEASLQRFPTTFKAVDEETMTQMEKLIGLLEDDEDVVSVYHNIEAS